MITCAGLLFCGEVLQRPNRRAWKARVAARLPWVRIPPSPPAYVKASAGKPAYYLTRVMTVAFRSKMWYIYVLRSSRDNNLYVGLTNDIGHRLSEHNSGMVESTRNRTPLSLEAYFALRDQSRAADLEKYFKTGSGRAFLQKRIL